MTGSRASLHDPRSGNIDGSFQKSTVIAFHPAAARENTQTLETHTDVRSQATSSTGEEHRPKMNMQLVVLQCPTHKVYDPWFTFSGDMDLPSEATKKKIYGSHTPDWWYDEITVEAKEVLSTLSHMQTLESAGYLSESKRDELQSEAITVLEDNPPDAVRDGTNLRLLNEKGVQWITKWQTRRTEAFDEKRAARCQSQWDEHPDCKDWARHAAQAPSADDLLHLYMDVQQRSQNSEAHRFYKDLNGKESPLLPLGMASHHIRREIAKEVASSLVLKGVRLPKFPDSLGSSKLKLFHETDEQREMWVRMHRELGH